MQFVTGVSHGLRMFGNIDTCSNRRLAPSTRALSVFIGNSLSMNIRQPSMLPVRLQGWLLPEFVKFPMTPVRHLSSIDTIKTEDLGDDTNSRRLLRDASGY